MNANNNIKGTKMESYLKITDGKGFHLAFENGLTISVQFGYGNYCANKHKSPKENRCTSAEIAIFPTKNIKGVDWLTNKFLPKSRGMDVVGWVKPDELASLIRRVQRSKILQK